MLSLLSTLLAETFQIAFVILVLVGNVLLCASLPMISWSRLFSRKISESDLGEMMVLATAGLFFDIIFMIPLGEKRTPKIEASGKQIWLASLVVAPVGVASLCAVGYVGWKVVALVLETVGPRGAKVAEVQEKMKLEMDSILMQEEMRFRVACEAHIMR